MEDIIVIKRGVPQNRHRIVTVKHKMKLPEEMFQQPRWIEKRGNTQVMVKITPSGEVVMPLGV